jgi:hypothetical protein
MWSSWPKDNLQGNPKESENNLPQYIHYITWSGIEVGSQRWEARRVAVWQQKLVHSFGVRLLVLWYVTAVSRNILPHAKAWRAIQASNSKQDTDWGNTIYRNVRQLSDYTASYPKSKRKNHVMTGSQSVSLSWCWVPSGAQDQIVITVCWRAMLLSLTTGWVCFLQSLLILASSHSRIRVRLDSWLHHTASDVRLPQQGGPCLCIYSYIP